MRRFLVLISFMPLLSMAQYGDLKIYCRFDSIYENFYEPRWDNFDPFDLYYAGGYVCDVNDDFGATEDSQHELGSTLSGSLDALLIMYEATSNKKYLREFMRRAKQVQDARADTYGYSTEAYWFRDYVAWHGRLLVALTHFVWLVEEHGLENDVILSDGNTPNYPQEYNGYTTYGSYANWLNTQNKTVMNFLLSRFWRQNNECMCKPKTEVKCSFGNMMIDHAIDDVCKDENSGTSKPIFELNMNAPFGSALIYLYLANPSLTSYGVKAVYMARAYLIQDGGILDYQGGHNAYTWHHSGWQKVRDNIFSSWHHRDDGVEDIGHAAWDIQFPLLYSQYYNDITGTITGNQYFEDYQMVRFKNTFSRFVYDYDAPNIPATYTSQSTFHTNIDGTDTTTTANDGKPQAVWQSSAKYWMNLYRYDDVSGAMGDDVYDILMNFYKNVERHYPHTDTYYGGAKIRALAEMCAANLEHEGLNPSPCHTISPPPVRGRVGLTPNPGLKRVKVSLEIAEKPITNVSICKIDDSRNLRQYQVEEGQSMLEIDVSDLPNGVYLVFVTDKAGNQYSEVLLKQ